MIIDSIWGYQGRPLFLQLVFLLFLSLLPGCLDNDQQVAKEPRKPLVVVTTTLLADMARAIGGEHIEVVALMGPGIDPHLYRPVASDVERLMQADVVLYNGLMLEGRMADTLQGLANQKERHVYAIGDGVPEDLLIFPENNKAHPDPHIWFDPRLWAYGIDIVVAALSAVDPIHELYFRDRGKAAQASYDRLLRWGRDYAASLPAKQRILITSHDAYNYFGRAYGFRVIGVQGVSTLSESGLADVTTIANFIKEHKIKAIFVESSVSPAAIENISVASGTKIGGKLFSDAMGAQGEKLRGGDGLDYDVGSYAGVTKYNITTIVDSLLGHPSTTGEEGGRS